MNRDTWIELCDVQCPVELPEDGALRITPGDASGRLLVLQTPPSFPTHTLLPSPANAKACVSTWGTVLPATVPPVTSAQTGVVAVPVVVRMIGCRPSPPA